MTGKRLKIAYVIDDLGYGGAQRQLSILVGALNGPVDPYVYCLSEITTPFAEAIRASGVGITVLPRSHGIDFNRLFRLAAALEDRRADVVHGFLAASNIYAFLASRPAGLPCVLSLRSDRITLGRAKGWCLRSLFRRADCVTVNSMAGARYLRETVGVDPGRVVFVPNAAAPVPDTVRSDTGIGQSNPTVGFVGRLSPIKRIDLLLVAFTTVLENTPEATLVIVGEGSEKDRLKDMASRLGIAERVTMVGAVDDVGRWMRTFSCLVLPSGFEGFPNVVIEALALGVPVIASRVGDLDAIVVDGETGFLLEDDSAATLASLITRALRDEPLRRRVRDAGPALVRAGYSTDTAVDKLLEVYRTVCRGR